MSARSVVWSFASLAALVLAGCGLTLDYAPPSTMDGSVADTGTGCASSCDDGLRCTADACTAGACQHTDTCSGETDCVSRGGMGECRRACTSADECADDNPCTDDVCDPSDQHCAHVSNCAANAPTCLDTGACVPTHCAADVDCNDHDDCNGMEVCTSGTCQGGTRVTCAAATGCVTNACDPTVGQCVRTLDAGSCDDSLSCTRDVCNDDGGCTHLHDDTVCVDADLCTMRTCDPATSTDATGCAMTGRSTCPTACGVMGMCDSASGSCNYEGACAAGQVCTLSGCQSAHCTSSSECTGIHSPDGCQTVCVSGMCGPPSCPPPPVGSCARADTTQCSSGVCHLVADSNLCLDGDALSTDVCDPATFTCTHTCPTPANSCIGFTYLGGVCRPVRDTTFCPNAHPTNATDCARSTCVGVPSATPTDDGCAPRAVDALCADAVGCTDDTCILGTSGVGMCSHTASATACDDAMDCTTDGCDPLAPRGTLGCTHVADDLVCQSAAGPLGCASAFCAQTGPLGNSVGGLMMPTGCALRYTPASCITTLGTICTLRGRCESVSCSTTCDDGVGCNGMETCVAGSCTQIADVMTCLNGTGTSCQDVCLPGGCAPPQIPVCGAMTIMD